MAGTGSVQILNSYFILRYSLYVYRWVDALHLRWFLIPFVLKVYLIPNSQAGLS